jgi:hypothetical protein
MNLPSILLSGFLATMVLTTVIFTAQALGLTRIDMPFILGTMVTPDRDRAKVIGYLAHITNGWIFAVIYALYFEDVRRVTWWLGATAGALQGVVVVAALLPLLPAIHPRMVSDFRGPEPARMLEPPGFLAANYGRSTPLLTIAAHALYGAIIGGLYRLHS